jgi:hypothetical protein
MPAATKAAACPLLNRVGTQSSLVRVATNFLNSVCVTYTIEVLVHTLF